MMEDEKTMLDLCAELLNSTELLKHLVAVGTLTENDVKDFSDLKGACIDFITAYEYYIAESPEIQF
jgi:hypothetical protein